MRKPPPTASIATLDNMSPAASSGATQSLVEAPAALKAEAISAIPEPTKKSTVGHDYKGFVAGVFSGVAKLTGKQNHAKPQKH